MRGLLAVVALVGGLAVALSGCGSAVSSVPPSTPSATGSVAPEPSVAPPGAAIELRRAPANLGCDAMRPPYNEVTFRIDPAAPEQVTALADTGATLLTYWSDGFVGGTADDPVVRDPEGALVASDGEVLVMPAAAWPRLAGYFVCPSTDALYVLIADPE